jgi:hypothetical protein
MVQAKASKSAVRRVIWEGKFGPWKYRVVKNPKKAFVDLQSLRVTKEGEKWVNNPTPLFDRDILWRHIVTELQKKKKK